MLNLIKISLVVSEMNYEFMSLTSCKDGIVGPANQNGCIILYVGKLADGKF
jgi:hypothetical protein